MTISQPDRSVVGRRALVTGWFSIHRGATAGDLLALEVVRDWLVGAGWPHDVALAPPWTGGVDWQTLDPAAYSHVLVVCGPAAPGLKIAKLIERFAGRRLIGVNLSMLRPLEEWNPFDDVVERDSARARRPDLAFVAPRSPVPVVGRVLAHTQGEYPEPRHEAVHAAIDRLLTASGAAIVPVDTRMPPKTKGPLRTAAQVQAVIARLDAVVTTRLHGLVLALSSGVPALAIDPIAGGAKVRAQAEVVGWPAVLTPEQLDEATAAGWLDWCLGEEARQAAGRCAAFAAAEVERVRGEVLAALGPAGNRAA